LAETLAKEPPMWSRVLSTALFALCVAGCNSDVPTEPLAEKGEPGPTTVPGSVQPGVVDRSTVQDRYHELIVELAYVLQDAAEAFAADNDGYYANSLSDRNPTGHLMADYYPEPGLLLMNPCLHLRNLPVDGMAALGCEVGYEPVLMDGYVTGYVITGTDVSGWMIVTLYR
jgi:hypothetical protein